MARKCPKCQFEILDDSQFCSKCGTAIHPGDKVFLSHTRTILRPIDELVPGTELAGKYKIIDVVGKGGMGIVYKAEDTKLKRNVALKFLPPELTKDKEAKDRFLIEAQAAAALSHPNICTVHEINEEEGISFIAMEYVEGQSLKAKIDKGSIGIEEAVDIAIQVAEGMEQAHKKGIVHRDIKSANIMVTDAGQAKIMDFGLAKVKGGSLLTREGTTLGTVAYMSPEQARGEEVDHRTDIWSLGIVMYEMLSSKLPFMGNREASILYSVVHEEPKRIKDIKPDIPPEVEKIISRAMNKKPESRFSSSAEMSKDLEEYLISLRAPEVGITDFKSFLRHIRKPRIAVPVIIVILAVFAAAIWLLNRNAKIGWARKEALPEIIRLVEEDNYTAAFKLAQQVKKYIPEDPLFTESFLNLSREVSIETVPPGADIFIRDYKEIESHWEHMGKSPVKKVRVPNSFLWWRIEKNGYRTVEGAPSVSNHSLYFSLDEEQNIPLGMVRVPAGIPIPFNIMPVELDDFFLDKYEVTNIQFKEFIENGGYRKQEYWKQEFNKDGHVLSWEEALAEFRDATGRPGPSTWELGDYPEGEDDHPVNGISWYEAAAYAEFKGKTLPTIFHWILGAGSNLPLYIIPLSNFSGIGPARVGSFHGMGPYGTHNMAGNVREWCWNESEGRRYIAGGTWEGPSYMYFIPDLKSPFDRSPLNGFRCMRYESVGEVSEEASQPIFLTPFRDYSQEKPVSDEIFQAYKSLYSYDKTELNPVIESTDETSKHWVMEKITFNAAYGNERVIAYLFLPKDVALPYQTVIFFPSIEAQYINSSENLLINSIDFIVRSDRAVLYPIYKSTYERDDGFILGAMEIKSYRDHVIMWFKDFSRSIDYLESRKDVDCEKLAYYGVSWGALMGSIFPAIENRIKASILELGGFWSWPIFKEVPEVDQINFAPHITIPTLMLNGRYDNFMPLDASQKSMFNLLGTQDTHKFHRLYEAGHLLPRNEKIKEILDWLDRYLGPVK